MKTTQILPLLLLSTAALPLMAATAKPPTVKPPQQCQANIAESTPTSDFEFLLDDDGKPSMVLHKPTHLIWKRCAQGQNFYDNGTPDNYADDYCDYLPEGATAAERSDKYDEATLFTWPGALQKAQDVATATGEAWRLPNIKELTSIVEQRCIQAAQNLTVFIDYNDWDEDETVSQYRYHRFWSSSPVNKLTGPAALRDTSWAIEMEDGKINQLRRGGGTGNLMIRLVKDAL